MKILTAPVKRILLQILFLLGCYFISRCLFFAINFGHFRGLSAGAFLRICFCALRYDISALCVVNSLYIVLLLFPIPSWRWPRWERFTQWVFVVINVAALLFDISDWAYFPYNAKRSTADVLNMMTRKGDFLSLLPGFLITYWYVPIATLLLVWGFIKVNKRIRRATPVVFPEQPFRIKLLLLQLVRFVLAGGLIVIGIRGGLQYVPIGIRNAVQVTESKYTPLVLNTPFCIINSYANDALKEVHYFNDQELLTYINTRKQFPGHKFQAKNVVVIILESFSKEFTGIGGGTSYTPFLDSLMQQSLVCTNAYANALRSADGIPAIIAGVPALQDEPFATSLYGTNRITALPGVLKDEGYNTAFYHGGTNGTMSFDVFAASAGFDRYRGRSEYANEKDYDGNWGIWDEPFLQYTAKDLGTLQQPFCAAIFTLSSHPPYKLPAQYMGRFPMGSLEIHPCIGYSDYALRRFFATAAQQPWFKNTLFVLSADHCSPQSADARYQNNRGHYAIPIIYYAPGDTTLRGVHEGLTQQLDILPSVLDRIGYAKPFFAFGNSIFQPEQSHYVVNRNSMLYLWMSNNHYLLEATDERPQALYNTATDTSCRTNLLPEYRILAEKEQQHLRALLQSYNNALIHNKMWLQD